MSDWRAELAGFARELGSHARRVARAVDAAADRERYHIVGYRSYASRWRALVLGRVLEHDGVTAADASHSGWRNLVNVVRRLESDPLPHATVRVRVGESEVMTTADDEGFFRQWVKLDTPADEAAWHRVSLDVLDGDSASIARGEAHVLVPPVHAAFGVISDMDDTVLQSEVTSMLRAARLMLLENSKTRLPFPGVAAFYRALETGGGCPPNPIFYVSSSPWNLYDVIADFLDAHQIPAGPLLLRDWDLTTGLVRHAPHKTTVIREIFDAYPWMRFILIGDSGHEDPEIYASLAREYPGRVLAIYIRDVTQSAARSAAIATLAGRAGEGDPELVLVPDTLAAARHAVAHGWVHAERLPEIGDAKRSDLG